MIEARVDTILRGVEYIGGGLYPEEIAKRKRRQEKQKKEKRACKTPGCITNVVSYNRDYRGRLETLCYKCRSREGYPTREYYARDPEDARRRYECPNGHDIAEVGRKDNDTCRECDKSNAKARYEANRSAANRTYTPVDSRIALTRLAALMEECGVSLSGLERKTGIPAATLRGYAKVGEPKGYKCPPERAKMIAGYFRVSVAELSEAGEES